MPAATSPLVSLVCSPPPPPRIDADSAAELEKTTPRHRDLQQPCLPRSSLCGKLRERSKETPKKKILKPQKRKSVIYRMPPKNPTHPLVARRHFLGGEAKGPLEHHQAPQILVVGPVVRHGVGEDGGVEQSGGGPQLGLLDEELLRQVHQLFFRAPTSSPQKGVKSRREEIASKREQAAAPISRGLVRRLRLEAVPPVEN